MEFWRNDYDTLDEDTRNAYRGLANRNFDDLPEGYIVIFADGKYAGKGSNYWKAFQSLSYIHRYCHLIYKAVDRNSAEFQQLNKAKPIVPEITGWENVKTLPRTQI